MPSRVLFANIIVFPPPVAVMITTLSKKGLVAASFRRAVFVCSFAALLAPGAIITAAILDNVATLSIPGLTGDTFTTSSHPVVIVAFVLFCVLARWCKFSGLTVILTVT